LDTSEFIRQRIGQLFDAQSLGVLATQRSGQPYSSLIAFWATEDLKKLYFATPRTTRKYKNLEAEPRVSILVNSSSNREADFHEAIAVTLVGEAVELDVDENSPIVESYLIKHPFLEDFVRSPTTAMVEIVARSFYMVQNFQNVFELHLNP
jgi:uncharacterized pyridoxamine 5'-phosphate oxidase family protein